MKINILIDKVTLQNVFPYSGGILRLIAQFFIVDLVMFSLYFQIMLIFLVLSKFEMKFESQLKLKLKLKMYFNY